MAILNAVPYHNEIYASLLWTLQQAGHNVTLFVEPREAHNMQAVIQSW